MEVGKSSPSDLATFKLTTSSNLSGLHNRQLRWFGALEYAAGVYAKLPARVGDTCSITDQATGIDKPSQRIDRRQGVLSGKRDDLCALVGEKGVDFNKQRCDPRLNEI